MYLQSAQLNLQLLISAHEAVLREARNWFLLKFNLESFPELVTIVSGQRNTAFRMVLGYWDMAVSLVTTGAIELMRSGGTWRDFRSLQQDPTVSRGAALCPCSPGRGSHVITAREAARAAAKARASEKVPSAS